MKSLHAPEIASRLNVRVAGAMFRTDRRREATYRSVLFAEGDTGQMPRADLVCRVPAHNGPECLKLLAELNPDIVSNTDSDYRSQSYCDLGSTRRLRFVWAAPISRTRRSPAVRAHGDRRGSERDDPACGKAWLAATCIAGSTRIRTHYGLTAKACERSDERFAGCRRPVQFAFPAPLSSSGSL